MYNRYIPQPDGSYRRNKIQESAPVARTPVMQQVSHAEPPCDAPEGPAVVQPIQRPQHRHQTPHKRKPPSPAAKPNSSALGFLQKLLPKDFDTGDLIIVLLLLLMAGDCTEDQNTALLTLALYFFM